MSDPSDAAGLRPVRHILAAAGCAVLAAVCIALGYRHVHLALAASLIDHAGDNPTPSLVARIESRLAAAGPEWLPTARFLRGQWRTGAGAGGDALGAGLEDFRWVSRRRPTWAPVWVAIVATKARLHENDAEFHHALERALATGPNETRSFTELFPWLRLRWHWLDEAQREALTEFAVRAAWREPKWVVEQAGRYHFLEPLCRRSGGNRLALLHCRRLGWVPVGGTA